MRALAILRALADVLEGARKGRSWRAFELEWFGRRVEEAREALASASPEVRGELVRGLSGSHKTLRLYGLAPKSREEQAMALAAREMLRALDALVHELEGGPAPPRAVVIGAEPAAPRPPKPKRSKAKRDLEPELAERLVAVYRQHRWSAPKSDPVMRRLSRARWARYVGQQIWWLTDAGRRRARELADPEVGELARDRERRPS